MAKCLLVKYLLTKCLLAKCLLAKCLLAKRILVKCLLAKCLLAKCLLAKCLLAKCLSAKCLLAKCLLAKCLLAKCLLVKCLLAKCMLAKCLLTECLLAKCLLANCLLAKCQLANSLFAICLRSHGFRPKASTFSTKGGRAIWRNGICPNKKEYFYLFLSFNLDADLQPDGSGHARLVRPLLQIIPDVHLTGQRPHLDDGLEAKLYNFFYLSLKKKPGANAGKYSLANVIKLFTVVIYKIS